MDLTGQLRLQTTGDPSSRRRNTTLLATTRSQARALRARTASRPFGATGPPLHDLPEGHTEAGARTDPEEEVRTEGVLTTPTGATTTRETPEVASLLGNEAPPLPVNSVVGCRLALFQRGWESLDGTAGRTIRRGVRLDFLQVPQLRNSPIHFPSRHDDQLEVIVQEMLAKGAIERVNNISSPGFYSRVFLRPKASGGMRPVIDLKALNRHILYQHFKMETSQLIRATLGRGEWTASVDLKDAYFHVPLLPAAKKYCRFTVKGQVFQFRTMPFGLCSAPREFTKLSLPILKALRMHGIKVHAYLDDWLIRGSSPQEVLKDVQMTLNTLQNLGWIINWEKSELTPKKQFVFLGLTFDLQSFLVAPSDKHEVKLRGQLKKLRKLKPVTASFLAEVTGLLQFLATLVHRGNLHRRGIQQWVSQRWSQSKGKWSDKILPDSELLELLDWWLQPRLRQGVPLRLPQPQLELCTDASNKGWGATLGPLKASGVWETEWSNQHINSLELEAVFRATVSFRAHLQHKVIRLFCDNATTIAYIKHEGGTKSPGLTDQVRKLLLFCDKWQIALIPVFLPGIRNVRADALSRRGSTQPGEWSLDSTAVQWVLDQWKVTPNLDMFATAENTRFPRFISPGPDRKAAGVDAMTISWNNRGTVYAFPPTILIPRLLTILQAKTGTRVILIAPNSPARSWFVDLKSLAVKGPLNLPIHDHLLSQPVPGIRDPVFHPKPETLKLAAWEL